MSLLCIPYDTFVCTSPVYPSYLCPFSLYIFLSRITLVCPFSVEYDTSILRMSLVCPSSICPSTCPSSVFPSSICSLYAPCMFLLCMFLRMSFLRTSLLRMSLVCPPSIYSLYAPPYVPPPCVPCVLLLRCPSMSFHISLHISLFYISLVCPSVCPSICPPVCPSYVFFPYVSSVCNVTFVCSFTHTLSMCPCVRLLAFCPHRMVRIFYCMFHLITKKHWVAQIA